MNADEIVRTIRHAIESQNLEAYPYKTGQDGYWLDMLLGNAAALIESQAAQLAKLEKRIADEGFSDLETMISKYKTVLLAANEISIETDEEIETLKNQLAASQRREMAAVEDLTRMANCYKDCGGCVYIGDSICKCEYDHAGNCYEWRGPVAGEESR